MTAEKQPETYVELTEAETAFLMRMLPHLEAGKDFPSAAAAVLEDDQRIYNAVIKPKRGLNGYESIPYQEATGIKAELARLVYVRILRAQGKKA